LRTARQCPQGLSRRRDAPVAGERRIACFKDPDGNILSLIDR